MSEYESNLQLTESVAVVGSTKHEEAQRNALDALGDLMSGDYDATYKVESWHAIYKYMTEHTVHLSPETWLSILEDKDIGPVVENRDERYQALIKSLPHNNGYPMRVNKQTFQPELYIDGKWLGIEAVKDPEPDLVEQQAQGEEIQQLMEDTKAFLAEGEQRVAEAETFMAEVESDLNYDDAMSVVSESK